jgi:hypothetical protein
MELLEYLGGGGGILREKYIVKTRKNVVTTNCVHYVLFLPCARFHSNESGKCRLQGSTNQRLEFQACPVATLKPHCIRCSRFKVDDVSALEASAKPPVRIVEDNVTASLHQQCTP